MNPGGCPATTTGGEPNKAGVFKGLSCKSDVFMETPKPPDAEIQPEEMPEAIVPTDIKAVFQGGQFIIMLLAACYFASEIILPIVIAFALMLVLQPAMRLLVDKFHLPRLFAALAIIAVLFGGVVGLGTALS